MSGVPWPGNHLFLGAVWLCGLEPSIHQDIFLVERQKWEKMVGFALLATPRMKRCNGEAEGLSWGLSLSL